MNVALRTTLRHLIMHLLFFLPQKRQVRVERWLRGQEDFWKLRSADCVIVSFGKSGRTWLRVMLSRIYQVRYGLAQRHLLAFDNLHNKVPAIPRIFFTHDNYLKDYTKQGDGKALYRDRVVTPSLILKRQESDPAGPRTGGCRGFSILSVEIPDDRQEEKDQQLPDAGRPTLRFHHDAGMRACEDHRLHECLGP
jgi:hypothetical protein